MTFAPPGYDLIELLRRGNDLDVYDAWSAERGCRVIIKALRDDRLDAKDARRRLLQEGELLWALSHPHIVRGYEVHDGAHPFVVLETLGGETLGHMIDVSEVELTVEQVAHLGLHLASAVRYLHGHGYLHLDLKPSNVIAEAGRAKVIDLSLARPPGRVHAGVGTDLYMAPEQVRGGRLTAAADVWGIGAVLFEAATLEPAFDTPRDDEFPQLHRRAPRVSSLRPVLAPFDELVRRCLDPDPAGRPSIAELLGALEPLAGVPPAERRHGEKSLTSVT